MSILYDDDGLVLEFDLRRMSGLVFEQEEESESPLVNERGHNLYEGIEDEIENMEGELKQEREREEAEAAEEQPVPTS